MNKKNKKDRLRLVTHPRSGTHWVLRTILENFQTPYKDYMNMFGTHKFEADIRERFARAHIIHCSRKIQPVLMSVFRMRERNGIKLNDFSTFIRTPYKKMPRIIGNCKIFLDDKLVPQARRSWIQDQPTTPPELWLLTNMFWTAYSDLNITYEQMKENQEIPLLKIQKLLGWKRKSDEEIKIEKTVGWHPPDNKPFDVSNEDMEFLKSFDILFEQHRERFLYDTL